MKNNFKRIFSMSFIALFASVFIFQNAVMAKKGKRRYRASSEYSEKRYIEAAYPVVIAADWYAVSEAFSSVGKKRKAELALQFAKRLEKLEASKMKEEEKGK